MNRRHLLALLAPLVVLPLLAHAAPPEVPGMHLQGRAQMRYLGFRIYDISLWTQGQVSAQNWTRQDLALELEYARSLSGKEIARRSLSEMRRQGDIDAPTAERWLAAMEAAFPDVKAGDRITGVFEPGTAAQFFVNGRPGQRIADPEFARLFFGIWLSAQSSEPKLRDQMFKGDGGGAQQR